MDLHKWQIFILGIGWGVVISRPLPELIKDIIKLTKNKKKLTNYQVGKDAKYIGGESTRKEYRQKQQRRYSTSIYGRECKR
jgi:hypothetical protein